MIKKIKPMILGLTLVFLFSLSVEVVAKDFKDLAKTSWAYNAVSEMTNYGVIDGYTDGTFKPQNRVTRAEFSKLLVATLGIGDDEKQTNPIVFEDVAETNWAYPYILKAGNYLTGYKSNNKYYFYPTKDAVREDMAVAIVVASGLSNVEYDEATLNKFKDANKITPSLRKYVAIAVEHGLMKGNSNSTFNATGTLTRAEAAQLMVNFVHSDKVTPEELEKMAVNDGTKPVLHEKYGYIDLGENYSKYQYSDGGSWYTAKSRYLHKTSNPKTGECDNFYGTDIQIKDTKVQENVYSFKVPHVAPIQVTFDKSTNKIDLGENWHAYDICTTDLETLKDAKSGSFKWVKAPERYITKGSNSFNKKFLFVRYECSDKTSYTADAVRYGDVDTLTWKKSNKKIEYTGTSYKLTEGAGVYYLTVGAGKKNTGGYSIEIVDAVIDGRNITVSVQETVPSPTAITTQAVNYPTATIELNGKPEKVTIKKLANKTGEDVDFTWKKSDKKIDYTLNGYEIVEEDGKVYIVVGAGKKSTGGYSIEVVDVHFNGSAAVIDVQQTVPAPTAITTQVINYPTCVIELNGRPSKVTLNRLTDKVAGEVELTWKKSDKKIDYTLNGYKIVEEDGKVYIVVGAGKKSTGGYSIEVVDVHFNGSAAVIDVQQTVPAPTAITTQVINYPTCVIELNGKPSKVTLNRLADKQEKGEDLSWKRTDKKIDYASSGQKIVEEDGKVYLVVGAGYKSHGGYSIEIVDVKIDGSEVYLDVQETIPLPTAMTTQAINYPTATIEILGGKPTKVIINKLDPKYPEEEVLPDLTWKETTVTFTVGARGYEVNEKNGKVYLTVSAGTKSHGGYSLKLTKVEVKGRDVTIDAQEYAPSPNAMTTQSLTYPSATIEISDRPNNVKINWLPTIIDGSNETLTWKTTTKSFNITDPYKVTNENGKYYLTVSSGPKNYPFSLRIQSVNITGKKVDITVAEERASSSGSSSSSICYGCATIEISGEPSSVDVDVIPLNESGATEFTWKKADQKFSCQDGYVYNEANGKIYLTIGIGRRPNGGYSVTIESAKLDGDTLYVTARTTSPQPGYMYTQSIVYPTDTIEVSRKIDKVEVELISDIQGTGSGMLLPY